MYALTLLAAAWRVSAPSTIAPCSFFGGGPMVARGAYRALEGSCFSGSWRTVALLLRGFQAAVDGVELGQVPGFAVGVATIRCFDLRVRGPARRETSLTSSYRPSRRSNREDTIWQCQRQPSR
jgi:hypothetical protein